MVFYVSPLPTFIGIIMQGGEEGGKTNRWKGRVKTFVEDEGLQSISTGSVDEVFH